VVNGAPTFQQNLLLLPSGSNRKPLVKKRRGWSENIVKVRAPAVGVKTQRNKILNIAVFCEKIP
jgi:hypothetical protein